jgi:DNA-binding NarL/FixJ family response regulator
MTGDRDFQSDRLARILIVDDEPLNLDYIEQELESLGFDTDSAVNGLEALARVAANPPDLVLLDVMMPELDGISALRLLKEDPETRLIPVVLMTALNSVEDRVRGIEAGADDFLSKPVDHRELVARIRTALRLRRAIDETVGELRSAGVLLERYGSRQREIAVLALAWRPLDASLPDEAAAFLVRRELEAAERRILALGGRPHECEGEGVELVAIFEDPDPEIRVAAALDAAIGLVESAGAAGGAPSPFMLGAAVSSGVAEVGSIRTTVDRSPSWVYGAKGQPVDDATGLARRSTGIAVTAAAAAAASRRFELEPWEGGAFFVLGPAEQGAEDLAQTGRRIRSILVTDIVGSTSIVERVGDRAWAELLAGHDRIVREEIGRFGGEVVDSAGDSVLALFDGPARAIRCALAVQERLGGLGISIRAGVHTGEVEEVAGRERGIAIHVTTRIAERARPDEVVVSATTRDLAAGSGLVFADRGEHVMKGVSEARHLFAAFADPVEVATDSSVPVEVDEYPAGLTAREVDVLRLVALGLSDAEVAERLVLSVRTVNAHLRSVYRKLGVGSREAAGRFAREHGLV